MSAIGYVFVGDAELARVVARIEPFAGPMSRRDDGAYISANEDVLVVTAWKPSTFDAEVHIYRGEDEEDRIELTRRVFAMLRAHGDVALEANYERSETLETFVPAA